MEGAGEADEGNAPPMSKKEKEKPAKQAEKNFRKPMQAAQVNTEEEGPLTGNYGEFPMEDLQSKDMSGRVWTKVGDLAEEYKEQTVLVRGRVHTVRGQGSLAFLVMREMGHIVQCVVAFKDGVMSKSMVKFVTKLNKESIVDVEGVVVVPSKSVEGTSQLVELHVTKVYCISKAADKLPINLEDAARSEVDIKKGKQENIKFVLVEQPTQLKHRVIDLRTPANQAIFRLDFEKEIKEHYFEVLDVLEKVFLAIFDGLNDKCVKQLKVINDQYPFEPLQEAGTEVNPMADFNTATEKTLGRLVKEKYNTDFYVLHRYPAAIRPFYTMSCRDDNKYSNSFDVFIRGEEIISGAQHIHDPELLIKRATECGIVVKTLNTYIESFRWGAPPHGGAGVGLEHVVMLFCALDDIRKTSLFPRDPKRLAS